MIKEQLSKNCPKCGKLQEYKTKDSLNAGIKNNTQCKSCANTGENNSMYSKTHSEETITKMRLIKIGKKHSDESKKKMSKNNARYWLGCVGKDTSMYGKTHSEETKLKMRKLALKRFEDKTNHPMLGKKHSEETKQKMSIAAIKRMESGVGQSPNFSPEACKKIDKYNEKHNYNFQHALNGGEVQILQFWVDGYDKERNAVIEIDEAYHYIGGKLRERDIQRQKEITEYLGCEFIRLKIDDCI